MGSDPIFILGTGHAYGFIGQVKEFFDWVVGKIREIEFYDSYGEIMALKEALLVKGPHLAYHG